MISSKIVKRLARKWKKMTSIGRKTISFQQANARFIGNGSADKSTVAKKGHFVIYTSDEKRHVMPLTCLSHNIFRELLKLSKEEFGVSSHHPIRLPCDSALLEYIIFIVQQGMAMHFEKSLLDSIALSGSSLRNSLHKCQWGNCLCSVML